MQSKTPQVLPFGVFTIREDLYYYNLNYLYSSASPGTSSELAFIYSTSSSN